MKQSAFPDTGINPNNQQEQQQSASSGAQTFWTSCDRCGMRYKYYRTILNRGYRAIVCLCCLKSFIATDVDAQGVPPAAKSAVPNIHSGIPQQEVSGQHAHGAGQQTYSGNASIMGFQGNVIGGSTTSEPWANSRLNADKGGFTNKGKGDNKVNEEVESGNELKFEKVSLQEVNKEEQPVKPSAGNGNRKRGKKIVFESNDCDSSTDIKNVVMEDVDAMPNAVLSESRHSIRISTQKESVIKSNEDESEDDKDGNNFVAPLSSKRLRKGGGFGDGDQCDKEFSENKGNAIHVGTSGIIDAEEKRNGKKKQFVPSGNVSNGNEPFTTFVLRGDQPAAGEHEEMVKAGSASTAVSLSLDNLKIDPYPDPEFYDFDKNRDESRFAADQVWAIYDDEDGMPRFYAQIKNVSTSGFKLWFTWLEHKPVCEGEMAWFDEGLPVACGNFRFGKLEWAEDRLMFSHVMAWKKDSLKNLYEIYPMKGEVWALFKNWDISWSCDIDSDRVYQYEVVEVLSNYEKGTDIRVVPLVKIKGFVALFMRDRDKRSGLVKIPSDEMLRFSHQVPCYRLIGNEREGIPEGFFELDSVALPWKFDETFPSISLDHATSRVKSFRSTTAGDETFASSAAKKSTKLNKKSPGWKVSSEEPADFAISSNSAAQHHDSSSLGSASPVCYEYPVSEFHKFQIERSSDKFQRGQIWALFSDVDKHPNYYGYIKKVEQQEEEEFIRVDMAWLEPCPSGGVEIQWAGEDIPVACGRFNVTNDVVSYDTTETFSHLARAKRIVEGAQYDICPRIGDVWAVYKKNWHVGLKLSDLKNAGYEIVEVISCTDSGIRVKVLQKLDGYTSVFKPERRSGRALVRLDIPTNQQHLRFSHRIPAFKLTEEAAVLFEGGADLCGYWELDPSSVPEAVLFETEANRAEGGRFCPGDDGLLVLKLEISSFQLSF